MTPFETPALSRAAIVKHTVPCGVAERASVADAVRAALEADAVSAYGGIIAVDGAVDAAAAEHLAKFFLEIVAAPAFDDDALARLRTKKNLRIMRYRGGAPERIAAELRVRSALGGVLAEDDDPQAPPERWSVVSRARADGATSGATWPSPGTSSATSSPTASSSCATA